MSIQKLQELFPLVDVETIKEIVAKNPDIEKKAIPLLMKIQEYKESVNVEPSAPSIPYVIESEVDLNENEGAVPLTDAVLKQKNNINNNMNEVLLLKTKEEYNNNPGNNYDAINSGYTDDGIIEYAPYRANACCECCCGDPIKPREPQWTCDCRDCCKCCFLLPNDNNYDGSKNIKTGGFLYEPDVKLFMYGFLILIAMSMAAEIVYDIQADNDEKKDLFITPAALCLTTIAVILYFMKSCRNKAKNIFISSLLFISAILYFSGYVYHTIYLKDFVPDCSNWFNEGNQCDPYCTDPEWCYYDYCGCNLCTTSCKGVCADGFEQELDDCYHFEKSYFVSRGIYIALIMCLLGLHFAGIKKVIRSRIGFLKFMMVLLIFYSICVGGVSGGSYYYQILSGCASFILALLFFILYFMIDRLNKDLKYKGGCNGIISIGTLMYIFLFWNMLAQLVTTSISVSLWGDDKAIWLFLWEYSITIFALFNFVILFRALHPCLMCKTCNC